MARWPGKIRPGSVSTHVGYFGDFFATAAELAGATPPANLDSISLVPTLMGHASAQRRHEFLYWEYHAGKTSTQAALLDGRWKGVRAVRGTALELYDLATDVGETHDVAARHPGIADRLLKYLAAGREEAPDWPLNPLPAPPPETR